MIKDRQGGAPGGAPPLEADESKAHRETWGWGARGRKGDWASALSLQGRSPAFKGVLVSILLLQVAGLGLYLHHNTSSPARALADTGAELTCGPECEQARVQSAEQSNASITVPCPSPQPRVYEVCNLKLVGGRVHGSYGAWPVCMNHIPRKSTVYSFGLGEDISFDIQMIHRGATVYGFDPTITPEKVEEMLKGVRRPEVKRRFRFQQVGLAAEDGEVTFFKARNPRVGSMASMSARDVRGQQYQDVGFRGRVLSLATIMAQLNHTFVDLVKVDVEGAEFDVCESPGFLGALCGVGQLVYEFHARLLRDPGARRRRCVRRLRERGFRLSQQRPLAEVIFMRVVPGARVLWPGRSPWQRNPRKVRRGRNKKGAV